MSWVSELLSDAKRDTSREARRLVKNAKNVLPELAVAILTSLALGQPIEPSVLLKAGGRKVVDSYLKKITDRALAKLDKGATPEQVAAAIRNEISKELGI